MRIIDHIIARLIPQCGPLAINANSNPARFKGYGLPVLGDSLPGFPGPLAGVLAAMDWAQGLGFSVVISVAGDTPFLPLSLVAVLEAHAKPRRPCIAATQGADGSLAPQPTFGLWPVTLRDTLRADLQSGARKVRQWATEHGATYARFECATSFFNVNTPDDLRTAETLLPQP